MQRDPELGKKIQEHLVELGLENPICSLSEEAADPNWKKLHIASRVGSILQLLGIDTNDDSLNGTPKRVAKMYVEELFSGLDYANFPKCLQTNNEAKNKAQVYDEMVCSKNITLNSTCEHHLVPFIGRASVAYIPGKRIIGLSKLNRIVNFFSRRPQVQERLTAQIHTALCFILETDDVAVVIEAEHLCVRIRGVQDAHSDTVTSKMGGRFMSNPALRQEFLELSKVRN
jgi:GTP cyclohydrolase I